jgi:hypothetical protein
MDDQHEQRPPLRLVEGGRDSLEREIATALFSPDGLPLAKTLLARLKERGRLRGVPATDPPAPPAAMSETRIVMSLSACAANTSMSESAFAAV